MAFYSDSVFACDSLALKLILLGAIGSWGFYKYNSRKRLKCLRRTLGNVVPPIPPAEKQLANIPGNDHELLLKKADYAFRAIQRAWARQDLSGVRRFLSDGAYQRFNTQFVMMRLLKQRNEISNVTIERIFIVRMEKDGEYDIAHVCITAQMKDRFICEMNSSLNSDIDERFTEYWSFIRKIW